MTIFANALNSLQNTYLSWTFTNCGLNHRWLESQNIAWLAWVFVILWNAISACLLYDALEIRYIYSFGKVRGDLFHFKDDWFDRKTASALETLINLIVKGIGQGLKPR